MRNSREFYPKSFCRDFIEIKGNPGQLMVFMAVVLGLKPFMDLWIDESCLKAFANLCKGYGLYLKVDCLFKQAIKKKIKSKVIGGEFLTSTVCYGLPKGVNVAGANAHVFVSKDKSLLKKGMWYPLVVKDRVISAPMADLLNYGFVLGYPDCCIKFFRRYNNWRLYSYLYQVYQNSTGYSYLSNPLLKDDFYSYIYHMPCSFNCRKTNIYSQRLRQEVMKREPDFIRIIDERLRQPFLVFYEKKIYGFKGFLLNSRELSYSEVYFVNAEEERNVHLRALRKGNRLRVDGKIIIIYKDGREVERIEASKDSFAPETPFLVQFN